MREPRIGRVLVASLHQAIADVLPARLEFYENWISVPGLRDGTIGLAPLLAVLSFLRSEGEAYRAVTDRAGTYAAEWTVSGLRPIERRIVNALPQALRTRAALRVARRLIRNTYPGSRGIVRVKGSQATIDLRGSLFCEVREAPPAPLCGFYAAAVHRVLARCGVHAAAAVVQCRGGGQRRGCLLSVVVMPGPVPASEPAAV